MRHCFDIWSPQEDSKKESVILQLKRSVNKNYVFCLSLTEQTRPRPSVSLGTQGHSIIPSAISRVVAWQVAKLHPSSRCKVKN